jgi:peptidyl-prolyl cis-trans isomerase A (cyclophilin A)
LSNLRYTIAMARLGGANPDTATSQFFVNVADNHACLDPGTAIPGCDPLGYAVFGQVVSGKPTIDRIAAAPTTPDALPSPLVIVYWAKQLTP